MDVALHDFSSHTAKGHATWEPSRKKLPHLDRMVLASRECKTAQIDQVTLVGTLQSGMRTSIWLPSQAALVEQIATVRATGSGKRKSRERGEHSGAKARLSCPRE